jgi:hypothetical protein
MILVGIGIGFGSAEWWSRFAMGLGTWSMVAPLVLGFYDDAPAFWTHVVAGLIALLIGIAGHEREVGATYTPERLPGRTAQSR